MRSKDTGNSFQPEIQELDLALTMHHYAQEGLLGMRDSVFPLELFPPFTAKLELTDPETAIATYLMRLVQARQHTSQTSLLLPSLSQLSRFFDTDMKYLRRSFWLMRQEGVDYIIPGTVGHITVWLNPMNKNLD